MEKALRKLAKQLNIYDEASLTALWEHLAKKVDEFEPTKEWEESVLMLSMVQALRWKNQLFNYNWSEALKAKRIAPKKGQENPWPEFSLEESVIDENLSGTSSNGAASLSKKRGKVLSFGTVKDDEPV